VPRDGDREPHVELGWSLQLRREPRALHAAVDARTQEDRADLAMRSVRVRPGRALAAPRAVPHASAPSTPPELGSGGVRERVGAARGRVALVLLEVHDVHPEVLPRRVGVPLARVCGVERREAHQDVHLGQLDLRPDEARVLLRRAVFRPRRAVMKQTSLPRSEIAIVEQAPDGCAHTGSAGGRDAGTTT
jgi:hypothetical protein